MISFPCTFCHRDVPVEDNKMFIGNELVGFHANVECPHCGYINRVESKPMAYTLTTNPNKE